jgi:hypothetical protein
MRNAVTRRRDDAEGFDDYAGRAIEQVNRPTKCVQEPQKRPSDHQGDAFGAGQTDRLRDKLAENYVDGAQASERNGQGNRVNQD